MKNPDQAASGWSAHRGFGGLDWASQAHAVVIVDALAQAGRIDILVNNAGYALYGLAETATLEQAKRIMETNFFGVVRMNRAVLPHMRRQGSGLLVHISSGAGRVGAPGLGLYSASKFALEALAEAYRYELAAQGIDSVIVEPGGYVTAVSMVL
jgi:NAD(P)-dependent dehydrogenase (short-subunit alcohol dehydrogenase family)